MVSFSVTVSMEEVASSRTNIRGSERIALAKERSCTALLEVKTVEGLRQSVAWLRETGRW